MLRMTQTWLCLTEQMYILVCLLPEYHHQGHRGAGGEMSGNDLIAINLWKLIHEQDHRTIQCSAIVS